MGRPNEGLSERFNFPLTPEQRAKLEAMAKATGRYPSQVLRLLIDQAELSPKRDIQLSGRMEVHQ